MIELEDEVIVDSGVSPRIQVAPIQKYVQTEQSKHAACIEGNAYTKLVLICKLGCMYNLNFYLWRL